MTNIEWMAGKRFGRFKVSRWIANHNDNTRDHAFCTLAWREYQVRCDECGRENTLLDSQILIGDCLGTRMGCERIKKLTSKNGFVFTNPKFKTEKLTKARWWDLFRNAMQCYNKKEAIAWEAAAYFGECFWEDWCSRESVPEQLNAAHNLFMSGNFDCAKANVDEFWSIEMDKRKSKREYSDVPDDGNAAG